jgi:tetratricopeptide (TPR) repeat protein
VDVKWQASSSSAALGRSSTDLVAELHNRHVEALEAAVRTRRRRKVRGIVTTIVSLALLAGLGFAGKLAWDHHRRGRAVESARAYLDAGTPGDLEAAALAIDEGLVVAPGDEESLALLALVRAHQAALGGDTTALREAIEAASDREATALVAAEGVAAAVDGDIEAVDVVLEKLAAAVDDPAIVRTRAWLQAIAALGRVHDETRTEEAIASLQSATEGDAWVPAHRALVALQLRAGQLDRAVAHLETARAAAPGDLGLAVDEALVFAIAGEHEAGVLEVSDRLADDASLSARDRGRARLARAIVQLRSKDTKEAGDTLDTAWAELPAWDLDARDLAIEAAMFAGDGKRAKAWIGDLDVPDEAASIYRAWLQLTEGDVAGSLERCAKLSQTHPRVAFVQALALVEQGRWQEAGPWIERASTAYPGRLELRVAQARVQANTGDAEKAADALEDMADAHPGTPRVHTALGQARLVQAGEEGSTKAAEKALERALEAEARPAEAAFLLGMLLQRGVAKKPDRVPKVVAMYERAVEIDDSVPRYRTTLGMFLASQGEQARAAEVLRTIVDEPTPEPDALLVLSRVTTERAVAEHAPLPKEDVEAWIAKAAEAGAPAVGVTKERARVRLAAGDATALPSVAAELGTLLASAPKDIDARMMHSQALRRLGDLEGARASVREGIARTLRVLDGRLYIEWAAIDHADGEERRAASLAYKGWKKVEAEPRPPGELVAHARVVADYWLEIDNTDVPRTIGRELVARAPHRADAHAFSARMSILDEDAERGCADAKKALELDPKLPEAHGAHAECLIARRDYAGARKELQTAIAGTKDDADRQRYKRRLRILR